MIDYIYTKTGQKVLSFLAKHPHRQFYGSQIAQKANVSLGAAHQILKKLTSKGLVSAEKRGRMIFYQIQSHHPLVKQIKTIHVVNQLIKCVGGLKEESQQIILFGSAARGENTADSDIDLFILTHNPKEVKNVFKRKGNLHVAPIIMTPNQWAEIEIKDPEFFQEVKRGIILYQKNE